jgi:hypothetical protein
MNVYYDDEHSFPMAQPRTQSMLSSDALPPHPSIKRQSKYQKSSLPLIAKSPPKRLHFQSDYLTLPEVVLCNLSLLDLSSSLLIFSRFTFSTHCSVGCGTPFRIVTLLELPSCVDCHNHSISRYSSRNKVGLCDLPDNAHSDPQIWRQCCGN